MTISTSGKPAGGQRTHEWEMISGFVLRLVQDRQIINDCMLAPIAEALEPYGLEKRLLCQISSEVEQTGEQLRSNCPEGKLDCINVRVHINRRALISKVNAPGLWRFYLVKQIASSESDNLDSLENPYCYIDLYIYQE